MPVELDVTDLAKVSTGGSAATPPSPPTPSPPPATGKPTTTVPVQDTVYNRIKSVVDELGCFDVDEIVRRTGYSKETVMRYLKIMERDTYIGKIREDKGQYCTVGKLYNVLKLLRKLRGEE